MTATTPRVISIRLPGPLDLIYDGITLGQLLYLDEQARRDRFLSARTKNQRDAISRYWSTELRNKIAAKTERERNTFMIDLDE